MLLILLPLSHLVMATEVYTRTIGDDQLLHNVHQLNGYLLTWPHLRTSCGTLDCLQLHLMRRPYIRPDGIYVKSFFLFSLNVLQTTISYLQVVPVPKAPPAPEDWLPAAGAHLVSYYIPEICSENERGLERQNLLPFFRYKTSWDTCQVELHLDPAASS